MQQYSKLLVLCTWMYVSQSSHLSCPCVKWGKYRCCGNLPAGYMSNDIRALRNTTGMWRVNNEQFVTERQGESAVTSQDENADKSRWAPVCVSAPAASFCHTTHTTQSTIHNGLPKSQTGQSVTTDSNTKSKSQIMPQLILSSLKCMNSVWVTPSQFLKIYIGCL